MKLTPEIVHGLVETVLSKGFDDVAATPAFHMELWREACSDWQFIAIAAPRGHAKSTAGTIAYGLAELLFRQKRYCVIVSDTESQAAMFVQQMTQELQTNQDLIELFGLKKDSDGKVRFIKDSQTDIIVEMSDGHTFRVIAKGAEQKLRGMLWDNKRPDLVLIDDLENDELVMNKERRDKLKRWLRAALIPAMSRSGKLRWWGTVLHEDSALNNLMPRRQDKWFRSNELKDWTENPRKTLWRTIKYRAHNPDFSAILWPERFDKGYFIRLRNEAADAGMLDVYSQEQLNEPIDESVSIVKRVDLLELKDEDRKKRVTYYITVDPAVTLEQRSDYTAFIVAGVDEDRMIQIRQVIRERMDSLELVDTIFTLQSIYQPAAFGIEKMMITHTIGPFLREEMLRRQIYPIIIPLSHEGKDKVQRFKNMQGRLRAKTVKVDKQAEWYPDFEDEVLKFPRGTKDDQVDALGYIGKLLDKIIEAPTDQEIEDEEYELEYGKSNQSDGRSAITGY